MARAFEEQSSRLTVLFQRRDPHRRITTDGKLYMCRRANRMLDPIWSTPFEQGPKSGTV